MCVAHIANKSLTNPGSLPHSSDMTTVIAEPATTNKNLHSGISSRYAISVWIIFPVVLFHM